MMMKGNNIIIDNRDRVVITKTPTPTPKTTRFTTLLRFVLICSTIFIVVRSISILFSISTISTSSELLFQNSNNESLHDYISTLPIPPPPPTEEEEEGAGTEIETEIRKQQQLRKTKTFQEYHAKAEKADLIQKEKQKQKQQLNLIEEEAAAKAKAEAEVETSTIASTSAESIIVGEEQEEEEPSTPSSSSFVSVTTALPDKAVQTSVSVSNNNTTGTTTEEIEITAIESTITSTESTLATTTTTKKIENNKNKKKKIEKKKSTKNNANVDMTLIVLSMDRFESLRRLLESLFRAKYPITPTPTQDDNNHHHRIDIQIRFDLPLKYNNNNNTARNVDVNDDVNNSENTNTTTNTDTNTNSSSSTDYQNWLNDIGKIRKLLSDKWIYGDTTIIISESNLGLAQSWFTAWTPASKFDRALILEDDLEVSPLYYQWLTLAHDNYGYGYRYHNTDDSHNHNDSVTTTTTGNIGHERYGRPQIPDLASISLARQWLIPLRSQFKRKNIFPDDTPFLYSLLGSHGFSPLAHIWMEFIDFVKCSKNTNNYNKSKCQTAGNVGERKRSEKALKKNIINEVDIILPQLVTSNWYQKNKRQMWTQHFIKFCYENQYYNMYRHTPSSGSRSPISNKVFIAHWKEKGAHFDGKQSSKSKKKNSQPLLQLDDINKTIPSVMEFPPSTTLNRYDWGGNLVTTAEQQHHRRRLRQQQNGDDDLTYHYLPPVVMSAAIGYSLDYFKTFIGTLREYYFGDVWLLISKEYEYNNVFEKIQQFVNATNNATTSFSSSDSKQQQKKPESTLIREYLFEQNVQYIEYDDAAIHTTGAAKNGTVWENINRNRFKFFTTVCDSQKYSLCLTTDFRDSIFQSNPFSNMHRLLLPPVPIPQTSPSSLSNSLSATTTTQQSKGILHVFEHNKDMSKWHFQKMNQTKCNLYNDYAHYLKKESTQIINGGSIIASPYAYKRLVEYMVDKWKGCNDQVILNVLVRSNILTTATTNNNDSVVVKIHQQGNGPMNVLGHGGKILRNGKKGKFLNRNCIVSPVVHQYDLVHCS